MRYNHSEISYIDDNMVPPEPERFYSCVVNLIDIAGDASGELAELGLTGLSTDLIETAKGFLSGYNKDGLIQMFIEKGHAECWTKVNERNDKFFLENADRLFGTIKGFDLNLFQDVFCKDPQTGKFLLSKELIDDVWLNLDSMIKISINYIHNMRRPGQVPQNGVMVSCYYNIFYNEVDLAAHAAIWKMELNFTR